MTTKTKTRVTLEEYLRIPEPDEAPYLELIDGEVIQKPMPSLSHATVVVEVITDLGGYLRQTGEGRLHTELRHAHRDDEWVFLPDISVTLTNRLPGPPAEVRGPVEVMPDFAIEVLSPDDQPGRVTQRIAHYMKSGVRLLWIIDPDNEQVTTWQPGRDPVLVTGGSLDAAPVLPRFSLDLEALFAALHR